MIGIQMLRHGRGVSMWSLEVPTIDEAMKDIVSKLAEKKKIYADNSVVIEVKFTLNKKMKTYG